MSLRVYNTLTSQKEAFEPLEPGKVRMYVCGPTVQDVAHLGHARCYVAWDVVARYLRFSGLEVLHIRNYTDVDDKIIARAQREGISTEELVDRTIAAWEADMTRLGVQHPDVKPRVTCHMDEIIDLVKRLVDKGVAYEAEGDVYFAVRAFPGYGKLSHRDLEGMRSGARVDPGEKKRDPLDFALWKAAKPGEPAWESPWGKGRPGWHIECSAMSMKYLGETFDIHAGGKDLVFPHHENEIAQSEAATGKTFVRYWMHNGFVNVDEEKMSKSLGNFFTVEDLLKRFDGETLRLALLSAQYRSPLNFTEQIFDEARRRIRYYYESLRKADRAVARLEAGAPAAPPEEVPDKATVQVLYPARIAGIRAAFVEAMDDDFNSAGALGGLSDAFSLLNEVADLTGDGKTDPKLVLETLRKIREELRAVTYVLGILQDDPEAYLTESELREQAHKGIDAAEVEGLIAERTAARKGRDFKRADEIRDRLQSMGVVIKDTPQGTEWTVE